MRLLPLQVRSARSVLHALVCHRKDRWVGCPCDRAARSQQTDSADFYLYRAPPTAFCAH